MCSAVTRLRGASTRVRAVNEKFMVVVIGIRRSFG
jgi:hypothetical protein